MSRLDEIKANLAGWHVSDDKEWLIGEVERLTAERNDESNPYAVCGIVSNSGPDGEPLGCGYPAGHEGDHAWASLPTSFKADLDELTRIASEAQLRVAALTAENAALREALEKIRDAKTTGDTTRRIVADALATGGYSLLERAAAKRTARAVVSETAREDVS